MAQYIIRRLLLAIPVIIGILIVTFAMARLIPGDPCRAILGEKATQAACERFIKDFGLDQPITTQFWIYIKDLARGDFGTSIRFGRPITTILIERLPMTIELGAIALLIAVSIGVPLGIISAVRRNSAIDVVTMIGANIGVSMPVYWLGLMLAYLFALVLKDTPFSLPPSGRLTAGLSPTPFYEVYGLELAKDTFLYAASQFISNMYILNSLITRNWVILQDAVRHLILPSMALSTIPLAIIARMTRSSMLEVLKQDYIRTARAKGLLEKSVVLKHALRNAMLPIVTIIGLQVGALFAGAVLTETIFGLAGVGRMLFEGITARDFPIIQGFTIVIAVSYVFINLLIDLSYVFIDPRIRLN
ncbi:MAG: ABC transporter permease [Anaerolineales bacterium]